MLQVKKNNPPTRLSHFIELKDVARDCSQIQSMLAIDLPEELLLVLQYLLRRTSLILQRH
jgi:hypothetical protein